MVQSSKFKVQGSKVNYFLRVSAKSQTPESFSVSHSDFPMDAALEGDMQVRVGEVEGGFDSFFSFRTIVNPGTNHHVVFVEFVVIENASARGVFVITMERAADIVRFVVVELLFPDVLV